MLNKEVIQPGDIVFGRSNTVCSKLMRVITLSQWSHVGIVIGRHQGKLTCVSARWNGVVYDNLIDWGSEVQILRVRGITEQQIQKMIGYVTTQVGKPIDFSGCFTSSRNCIRWFDSMLIYFTMLKAGIDIFKESHKRKYISTGDLYENPRLEFITEI